MPNQLAKSMHEIAKQNRLAQRGPTNADLIRAMDDEELARALKGAEIQALLLGTTSTEGVWLDWLRQPAEEVRDGQTI